jgi:membrane protein
MRRRERRAAALGCGAMDHSGRDATSPWHMPWPAWRAVLVRTYNETNKDNIGLLAAGVAFYAFLALVPLMAAFVMIYGLFADPHNVVENVRALMTTIPREAAKLIGDQLMALVKTSDDKKGIGLIIALALAVFGARSGAGAIVTALNIAYEEREHRNILQINLLSLAITVIAVAIVLAAIAAIAALAAVEALLPVAPDWLVLAGTLLTYVILLLVGALGAAALYRFGPCRAHARWRWLTPGSVLASLLWLLFTFLFGVYVANFAHYNTTYGSLGAVVVLLTWLYWSAYVLLLGAELNAELEHQTEVDSTTGPPAPIGERGAWVADHVAEVKQPARH